MLIVYLQVVTKKRLNKKHHFQDEKYKKEVKKQSKVVLSWRAKMQNSLCETWIEQVKGQAMAGATLTNDFLANDILWQLFQKLSVKWSLLQFYRNNEIISIAN